jgi:hypothetical protein
MAQMMLDKWEAYQKRIADLEAEIERLRAALRPFAAERPTYETWDGVSFHPVGDEATEVRQ